MNEIVNKRRSLWLDLGLTTYQPKWHLVFDGHLLEQVKRFGGLGDKCDDMIEKAHQPWKREKERTWGVQNFKNRQQCQLNAVRRRNHHLIETKIAENEKKRERNFKTNLQQVVAERRQAKITIKKEIRKQYVA